MIFKKNNPAFCKKKFYALFWSGIATSIMFVILSATDAVLAGIFAGEEGVSAISVTAPAASVIGFIISIFVSGCRIIYPEEIGKYDKKKAGDYFSTSLTAAVVLSVVFLILIVLFGEMYFDIYKITDSMLEYAKQYFMFCKYVYVLTPLVAFISQMVYCDGDIKIGSLGLAVFFVANIILSIIGAMTMGMAGIGLGTLISGIICFGINCIHFFRESNTLRYHFHFSVKEQLKVIKYSFMESTFALFSGVNGIIITAFLCIVFGSEYLAVNSIVGYTMGLTGIFGGLSEAMIPILNTYRGEENPDGVKKILGLVFKWLIILSIILTIFAFIAAPLFPMAFSITSPELMRASINGIRITSLSYVFIGIMTVFPTYYNAQGKAVLSTVVARFKDSFFYVLFFVMFGLLFGLDGVWIGIMLSPVAAAVLMLVIVGFKYGRNDLLMLPDNGKNVASWDLILGEESIIELRDSAKDFLKENGISDRTQLRAALLIEEVYMRILENNKGNDKVMAELTIMAGDDVEIIFRDNGNKFDLTDEDAPLTSLRDYMISVLAQQAGEKNYAASLSFNRTRFRLREL